jgi:hypothetical protein
MYLERERERKKKTPDLVKKEILHKNKGLK